jgi:hypothetical protein
MRLTQLKTQATGRRVLGFLDAHAAIIGTAVPPELRTEIDDAVNQLTTNSVTQETSGGSAKSQTGIQDQYRRDLYVKFVRPIARITKRVLSAISVDDRTALVLKADDTRQPSVVTKVTALANAAEKYQAVFVRNGMAADFVAQLRAAIAQLTSSIDTRDRQVGQRKGATAALVAADKSFKTLLRQLDSVLHPVLRANPGVLADWTATKHIVQITTMPAPTGGVVLPITQPSVTPAGPVTPVTPVTPVITPAKPAA